jgi:hypothetical protein
VRLQRRDARHRLVVPDLGDAAGRAGQQQGLANCSAGAQDDSGTGITSSHRTCDHPWLKSWAQNCRSTVLPNRAAQSRLLNSSRVAARQGVSPTAEVETRDALSLVVLQRNFRFARAHSPDLHLMQATLTRLFMGRRLHSRCMAVS